MRTHDELKALAAEHALGILQPDARKAFEKHLSACDDCRQQAAGFRDVAALLPLSAGNAEPPPQLKERILAAARAEKVKVKFGPGRNASWIEAWRRLVASPAAVGAILGFLLLAVAGLSVWVFQAQRSLDSAQGRLARSYLGLAIMAKAEERWQLEGTPLASDAEGAVYYSSRDDAACLFAANLPTASGERYLAWTVKAGVYARAGALWPSGEGLWQIIPGDVHQWDAITITTGEAENSPDPADFVVARVVLAGDWR